MALRAAPDAPGPAGCGGRRPPGQPGQRRPARPGPTGAGTAGRRAPAHARAPGRRRWGGRPRRRGRPAGPGGGPGPGGHGVPPLPRERRAGPAEGRPRFAGRSTRTARHPGLQRPAGAGARQRHGAGPSRRAGRLSRDQQRDPAAARRGRPRRRPGAHEPLRGDRRSTGPRPVRRPRWSSGWCRECGGERARQTKTIEFTPPDEGAVADALRTLRAAGSGWVNLMPGIDEEASDVHPRAGLFAFFGNNAAPVTMTTLMPPKKDRSDDRGADDRHHASRRGQGRGAAGRGGRGPARRMGRAPGPRAAGACWCARRWRWPSPTSSDGRVRAGTALCRAEMTGRWRAVVYLP